MNVTVKILREQVLRSVARRMEWEGTRSPLEKDAYGRVAVSDSDSSLMQSLFDEAAMQAVDVCRPFLRSVVNSDKALELRLALSDSTPADMAESLDAALSNMVSAAVLALWMEIVCPERAAAADARRSGFRAKALETLYHHDAPVRKNS